MRVISKPDIRAPPCCCAQCPVPFNSDQGLSAFMIDVEYSHVPGVVAEATKCVNHNEFVAGLWGGAMGRLAMTPIDQVRRAMCSVWS